MFPGLWGTTEGREDLRMTGPEGSNTERQRGNCLKSKAVSLGSSVPTAP